MRRRCVQFVSELSRQLPQLAPALAAPEARAQLQAAAMHVLEGLPAPDYQEAAFDRIQAQLQLRFKHDCE